MKGQGATFFIGAADPAQIKPEASVLPGNTNAVVLIVLQVGLIEPGPAVVTGQREAMGQEHLEAQIVVPSGTVTEKIMTVVNLVAGREKASDRRRKTEVNLIGVIYGGLGPGILVAHIAQIEVDLLPGRRQTGIHVQLHTGAVVTLGRAIDVGGPNPGVDIVGAVFVVEPALDRRPIVGLTDATEHEVGGQGHVGAEYVGGLRRCQGRAHGAFGQDKDGYDGPDGGKFSWFHGFRTRWIW